MKIKTSVRSTCRANCCRCSQERGGRTAGRRTMKKNIGNEQDDLQPKVNNLITVFLGKVVEWGEQKTQNLW